MDAFRSRPQPARADPSGCHACRHYFITHEPAWPYGCRHFAIKTRAVPSLEIERTSGRSCQAFSPKAGGLTRASGESKHRPDRGPDRGPGSPPVHPSE